MLNWKISMNFRMTILNSTSMWTWWWCSPALFGNDSKSIYVLLYKQEHPKMFNSRFKVNESQTFSVYLFFFLSPGAYAHNTIPNKRVSWPMKFGSPDWSKVPLLERRALRTEVQICLILFCKLQIKEAIKVSTQQPVELNVFFLGWYLLFSFNFMCFVHAAPPW